ncbi:MAG: phosphate ABC transporter substrate-binding protein PstS [Thermoplasmata archaeon]
MSGQPMGSNTPNTPQIARRGRSRGALYAVVAVVIVVVVVLAVGASAGWFTSSSSKATGNCSANLKGAGSTLVAPLMFYWATTYTASNPNYGTVNYASVGSGAGINDIGAKTVDYGASDAPLNAAQTAANPGLVTIPESAGAVVPIYNLPGVGNLHFTGALLAQIYLGQITNWNNTVLQGLNPTAHLPTATIGVVHRSDGSGTTFIWTTYLSLESSTWASQVGRGTAVSWPTGTGESGNAGVAGYVKNAPDSLGYVDLNYALTTGGVTSGLVQNPSGNFIFATVNNTASAIADSHLTLPSGSASWYNVSVLNAPGAGDYPISSLTYMFVYQSLSGAYPTYTQTQADSLVNFIHWVLTTGQSYSAQLYYVPLPAAIIAVDMTTLGTITFNGAAPPMCT